MCLFVEYLFGFLLDDVIAKQKMYMAHVYINQSINQSFNQSINQSGINCSINQIDQSANQCNESAAESRLI